MGPFMQPTHPICIARLMKGKRGRFSHLSSVISWVLSRSDSAPTEHVVGPERVDAQYITEARFVPRRESKRLPVYPPELKDELWRDLAEGYPETWCLGLQSAFPGAPEGD